MVCRQTIVARISSVGHTPFATDDSLAVCCANFCGGDDRDRTGDPLLAKQVLSQLSYAPNLEI
jgi:hypothetical protein